MRKRQKIWARLLSIMFCFLLIVNILPINLMAAEFNTVNQSVTEQIEQETDEIEILEQEEQAIIENTEAVELTKQEEDSFEIHQENGSTAVIEQNTQEEITEKGEEETTKEQEDEIAIVEESIDNIAATNLNNPRIVEDSSIEAGKKVIWDCVWFGSYPQSEITSSDALYNELKNATGWDVDNNITIDGNRYRRIRKDDATYATSGDDEQYNWSDSTTYHYFKYEPIKWRVLNVSGGQALLLADVVLDDQKYNLNYTDVTWESSSMRSWLNGYNASSNEPNQDYTNRNFINSAFSNAEQEAINTTNVVNDGSEWGTAGGNDTSDKVFLLSDSESYNEQYGFIGFMTKDSTTKSKGSIYAKAMGIRSRVDETSIGECSWWLRSPGRGADHAAFVSGGSDNTSRGMNVDEGKYGVRPALKLNLSYSQYFSYAGIVSSDGILEDIIYKESVAPDNAENLQLVWGKENDLKATFRIQEGQESSEISKGNGVIKIYYADNENGANKKIWREIAVSNSDIEVGKTDNTKIEVNIRNVSLPYGKYINIIFDDVIRIDGLKQSVFDRENDWFFTTSNQVFRYGIDTFNFINSGSLSNFNISWGALDIDKKIVDKELASFDLIDRVAMYKRLKEEWKGSCYGMSVLTLENLIGELDEIDDDLKVDSLYNWSKPKDSKKMRTYLQISHVKTSSSRYKYEVNRYQENMGNWETLYRDLYETARNIQEKKENPAVVTYTWLKKDRSESDDVLSHAVIIYGVDVSEAPYIFDGKEYAYKILTIDPNIKYNKDVNKNTVDRKCIYLSSDFKDFIIPEGSSIGLGNTIAVKSNRNQNGKCEFERAGDGYIGTVFSDISVLDPQQSYRDESGQSYASITIKKNQDLREEWEKAAYEYFGNYLPEFLGQNWDELLENEIYPYIIPNVLADGTSSSDIVYSVPVNDNYNLKFTDGYVNCDIQTTDSFTDFSSDSATEILVSKDKNVVAKGVTGEYKLGFASEDVVSSINSDEVIVSGKANSDDVAISPSTEGIIIENNNGMNNITVKVSTGFEEAEKTFTEANATIALVKTIEVGGEEQVKIYIDKDKDGTFETDIDEASTINVPAKTTITSLENVSEGMELTWNKVNEAEGYQVQCATNKDFTSATSLTVKGASAVSKVISGLTVNKKYYVRVRAYKTVNNKKYYAKWSDTKTIMIKEVEKPVSTKVKDFVKKYVSSSSGKAYDEANIGNYVQILKGISTWNSLTSIEQKQANQLISAEGKITYKKLYNAAEKIRKQCITDDGGNLASIPMTATGKATSTQLTWSSVKGADGYYIYANRCNKGDKKYKWKCVKTIKSGNTVTYTHKNLLKNTGYKYRVGAYATINGKKVLIARSLILHSYTTSSSPKYKNPSQVTVSNEKVSLKVGKKKKITAKISGYTKGKKISNHVVKIRYIISDPAIASISLSGTMKAKKAGSCTIWACAQNGVRKAIKVTVTK